MADPGVRLVIAGEHRLFREALGDALASHGHVVLASTALSSGLVNLAARYQPEVCLLVGSRDLTSRCLTVLPRRVGQVVPGCVLALLGPVTEAPSAGPPVVVIPAEQPLDMLARRISALRRGVVSRPGPNRRTPHPRRRPRAVLTAREREVLAGLVDGYSTDRLADALRVSRATVRCHVQRILVKLGARSRLEAVAIAERLAATGQAMCSSGSENEC